MKRPQVNAWVDAAAFVAFALLVGTGLLLEFRLPPGSGDLHAWSGGRRAAAREVLTVWDLTRHQWGTIHFWIAAALMTLLAVHLALHWKWIVCTVSGKAGQWKSPRLALGALALLLTLLAAAAPFFSRVNKATRAEINGARADIAGDAVLTARH